MFIFLLRLNLGHAMPIRALCFSPDSQVLASASDDCHIRLHDLYILVISYSFCFLHIYSIS